MFKIWARSVQKFGQEGYKHGGYEGSKEQSTHLNHPATGAEPTNFLEKMFFWGGFLFLLFFLFHHMDIMKII